MRSTIARDFIELIKTHVVGGASCLMNPRRYKPHITKVDMYTWCLHWCTMQLLFYIQAFKKYSGDSKAKFFFEEGHESSSLAGRYLSEKMQTDDILSHLYAGHSFSKKEDVPILQAADILAWQSTKFIKGHYIENRPARKDFSSLMEIPNAFIYWAFNAGYPTIHFDLFPTKANRSRDELVTAIFDESLESDAILYRAFQTRAEIPPPDEKADGWLFT